MKHLGSILGLLLSLNAAAQMNEGSLVTKNVYYSLPYKDTKHEIQAKATIKGDTWDMMIDSGAPAFISSELQAKYHFKVILRTTTRDAGGLELPIDIVNIDTLKFGPFVLTDIPAIVFDMKNTPISCYGIAGNIGSNVLRHLIVQFDVAKGVIEMADNEALLKKHIQNVYPMRVDGQSDAYFPIMVEHGIVDTIHFDTGDGQLYNASKAQTARYADKFPKTVVRKGFGTTSMGIVGVGGSFEQYVLKPQLIYVGASTISGGIIHVAGNDKSRMGRELFNYGILKLDYIHSMYGFEAYGNNYKSTDYDYGFFPMFDEKKVFVGSVWDGTKAKRSGMAAGDELLQLNGKDLSSIPQCDIEGVMRAQLQSNKESISVTFRHKGAEPKTVTLSRKPL